MEQRQAGGGTVIRRFFDTLMGSQRRSEFICADCARWARCGMASSDDCPVRAGEIASGDWRARRRNKALSLAMGCMALMGRL